MTRGSLSINNAVYSTFDLGVKGYDRAEPTMYGVDVRYNFSL